MTEVRGGSPRSKARSRQSDDRGQAAHALGLWYRVYRTGGRSTHGVLPLPSPVTLRVAHWIEWAYRAVLRPQVHRTATVDKSNLSQLMRLPGGLHVARRNLGLGLWIDVDAGCLYDIGGQARIMAGGFTCQPWPSPRTDFGELLSPTQFRAAVVDIDAALDALGVGLADALPPAIGQSVCAALTENALVARVRAALPRPVAAGSGSGSRSLTDAAHPETTVGLGAGEDAARSTSPKDPRADADESELAWATRVWAMGYSEGGFWDWLNGGGSYGIRAAYVLYGPDRYEAELKRQAATMPWATPGEVERRAKKIEKLCKSYDHRAWGVFRRVLLVPGEVTEEMRTLAGIVRAMVAAQPYVRTTILDDVEHLALLLLAGLRHAETGELVASYEGLADSVGDRWPEVGTWSRLRASRLMERLTEGHPKCAFALVRAVPDDLGGQVMTNHYRVGTDLAQLLTAHAEERHSLGG